MLAAICVFIIYFPFVQSLLRSSFLIIQINFSSAQVTSFIPIDHHPETRQQWSQPNKSLKWPPCRHRATHSLNAERPHRPSQINWWKSVTEKIAHTGPALWQWEASAPSCRTSRASRISLASRMLSPVSDQHSPSNSQRRGRMPLSRRRTSTTYASSIRTLSNNSRPRCWAKRLSHRAQAPQAPPSSQGDKTLSI